MRERRGWGRFMPGNLAIAKKWMATATELLASRTGIAGIRIEFVTALTAPLLTMAGYAILVVAAGGPVAGSLGEAGESR